MLFDANPLLRIQTWAKPARSAPQNTTCIHVISNLNYSHLVLTRWLLLLAGSQRSHRSALGNATGLRMPRVIDQVACRVHVSRVDPYCSAHSKLRESCSRAGQIIAVERYDVGRLQWYPAWSGKRK